MDPKTGAQDEAAAARRLPAEDDDPAPDESLARDDLPEAERIEQQNDLA